MQANSPRWRRQYIKDIYVRNNMAFRRALNTLLLKNTILAYYLYEKLDKLMVAEIGTYSIRQTVRH